MWSFSYSGFSLNAGPPPTRFQQNAKTANKRGLKYLPVPFNELAYNPISFFAAVFKLFHFFFSSSTLLGLDSAKDVLRTCAILSHAAVLASLETPLSKAPSMTSYLKMWVVKMWKYIQTTNRINTLPCLRWIGQQTFRFLSQTTVPLAPCLQFSEPYY